MPPSNFGGIFLISVIFYMKDLEIKGIRVRVTKYKVMIYDDNNDIDQNKAAAIALYLRDEGFMKKDEFPIEIIKP